MSELRLNPPALDAFLTMATQPQRYVSIGEIASVAGVHPTLLSKARKGERGMGDTVGAVAAALGVPVEAITVPITVEDEVEMRIDAIAKALALVNREFVQLHRIAAERLTAA